MTKERPILFNGAMVRAILAGRKTQTRRAIKPQPADDIAPHVFPNAAVQGWRSSLRHAYGATTSHFCPFGQPGDRLWVRETWGLVPSSAYRASVGVDQTVNPAQPHDAAIYREGFDRASGGIRWRPSIHMPRWASRLTLTITDVRVERLQRISEADARAEGVSLANGLTSGHLSSAEVASIGDSSLRRGYANLWNSLNAARGYGWDANPWVWVVSFERTPDAAPA
jgi:hypothetical protein